jgi:hypothetical protein
MEEGLPLALVCTAVAGLTVAFFGLPKAPPPPPSRAQLPPNASARRMDEALTRAIAALRAARSQADSTLPQSTKPAPRAGTVSPATSAARAGTKPAAVTAVAAAPAAPAVPAMGLPAPTDPVSNAPTMSAVTSLTEAVKAVRSARTEEDFVRAEQQMRGAREQMQVACTSGANSAFCDSAREMSSLGF